MQITQRDFEIINFVLNMKFASVQDVHQKFFKVKRDGSISTNEWYVRERLRHLVAMGYLRPVRYRFEHKSYYIGTKHGYELIYYMQSVMTPSKHIEQIDVRTFDHDIQVMKSRLALEDSEKVQNWQSDRQLKCQYTEYFQFKGSRDSAPDGVYTSLAGKIIAFEYEIAQKSKQRYRDKVRRYVECIRRREPTDGPKYDHVRIICEKPSVYKILKDATAIYRDFFTIEMVGDFFASLAPQANATPLPQAVGQAALQ